MGYYPKNQREWDCLHCGRPLTGRQEAYCSNAHRMAHKRAEKREAERIRVGRPRLQTCPLCGEGFLAAHNKKYCDYYEEAEEDCRNAQDDLEEAAEIAAEERLNALCLHCNEPVNWSGRGRPKKFCSAAHKVAYSRKQKSTV